ncbi:MAG TPA: hypothetical protein P5052_00200 [Candidatus Paceibacterota bacterium]|nr:hypothetical protein [Candidatus Paceibacterota bacterium]HRZ29238.1 hypothetical protein [Candidatus Paceibacterota bacterium]
MKKILLLIILSLSILANVNIVMAQTAATTTNDFVVLENPVGAGNI